MNAVRIPQKNKKHLRQYLGERSCFDPEDDYKEFTTQCKKPQSHKSQSFILDEIKKQQPSEKAIEKSLLPSLTWSRTSNMPNIPRK
jgi:hypothetical protein